MEFLAGFGYVGLFIAAFLAATILPLSSELVFIGLLLSGFSPPMLLFVATLGNVLGSVCNYALGYFFSSEAVLKWLGLSEAKFNQAKVRYQKYGMISLCFAWVPIIGDPLTVVAGVLRVPLSWFLILVSLGKFMRYVAIYYLTLHIN